MNRIALSKDKKFFEVWHNGTLIKHQAIWTDKYRLFCECLIYLYKWSGDQSPTIEKEVIYLLEEVQPYIAKE